MYGKSVLFYNCQKTKVYKLNYSLFHLQPSASPSQLQLPYYIHVKFFAISVFSFAQNSTICSEQLALNVKNLVTKFLHFLLHNSQVLSSFYLDENQRFQRQKSTSKVYFLHDKARGGGDIIIVLKQSNLEHLVIISRHKNADQGTQRNSYSQKGPKNSSPMKVQRGIIVVY